MVPYGHALSCPAGSEKLPTAYGGTWLMVARVLPSAGGMCATGCLLGIFLDDVISLVLSSRWPSPTLTEVPLLPRSKFISLILHLRASAYLLRGTPFNTWEMKLKTMSWEVYMKNKRSTLSLTGRNQGQVWHAHSNPSCRENAMQGSLSTGIP